MSTTSTTAPVSRSPSPLTPEAFDSPEPIAIQSEIDFSSSWCYPMHSAKPPIPPWASDPAVYSPHQLEDDKMLRLDDLIEQDAYDDSPSPEFNSSLIYSPQPSNTTNASAPPLTKPSIPDFRTHIPLATPRHGPIALTKPIPPPASLPRKLDPSTINQRVVYPPKESCFNLPIMFPSIPEGGTKSRVETQVRVTLDLADSSSSSDPYKYNRVGSWKWLKLPYGTATKKRTRKQGKIDPESQDILHLTASVTCASPPHNRVLSCTSCQTREAKRVAKKLAARVRPARSDSESEGDGSKPSRGKHYEDTTSIIQFNCAEVLDFSTGSVVLPLRITCYCRHHREKVGFNVHFTMVDDTGRVVGVGMSKPIMITDDHKTSTVNRVPELIGSFSALDHPDWSQVGGVLNEVLPQSDSRAPSRRKKEFLAATSSTKKRPKPYDSSSKPSRVSREGSESSAPSPSTSYSPLPTTRASTPASSLQNVLTSEPPGPPPLHHGMNGSETSSPDTLATPLDHNSDVHMPEINYSQPDIEPQAQISLPQSINPSSVMMSSHPQTMPFLFFDPTQAQQPMGLQIPTIHRLIPNTGPTHGGIEVIVLGANFHPSVQLNCVFGDIAASSTQRWSDNTLVCLLPPRATPGIVAVWFEGFPKADEQRNTPPSLFTYSDESDRALMELALQVVGLKMTGKIEDAKNVAMRIVGNAAVDGPDPQNPNTSNMMQLASASTTRDLRRLLFRGGENNDFETLILDFLSILDTPLDDNALRSISIVDAISHPSDSGQTLLHLAAILGFSTLTSFLIKHYADLDARDRNGFTPLHFAALSQSRDCAAALLGAGADVEIVNNLGRTAQEISRSGFFEALAPSVQETNTSDEGTDDEDADLGDAEDDYESRKILPRRISRRSSRHNLHLGRGNPSRSLDASRAGTPPLPLSDKPKKMDTKLQHEVDTADAQRAASFMEKMFQRTLAQFPAPQGILPQLPLRHLPDLPAVPWGALPQFPMVFPVYVPMMVGWPSFLTGENAPVNDNGDGDAAKNMGTMATRAAQSTWEKWVALAVATTTRQQTEEMPPPVYTPRATEPEVAQESLASQSAELVPEAMASTSARPYGSEIRPVGYDSTPLPEQVVESFGYQPTAKQTQKLQKKHDRMLLLFWLPVLLLSILWAFHNGLRFAFQAVKMALPVKTPLRS